MNRYMRQNVAKAASSNVKATSGQFNPFTAGRIGSPAASSDSGNFPNSGNTFSSGRTAGSGKTTPGRDSHSNLPDDDDPYDYASGQQSDAGDETVGATQSFKTQVPAKRDRTRRTERNNRLRVLDRK